MNLSKKSRLSIQILLFGMMSILTGITIDAAVNLDDVYFVLGKCKKAHERPAEEYKEKRYDPRPECIAFIKSGTQEDSFKLLRSMWVSCLSDVEDKVSASEQDRQYFIKNNSEFSAIIAERSLLLSSDLLRRTENDVKNSGFADLVKPEPSEYTERIEQLKKETDKARNARQVKALYEAMKRGVMDTAALFIIIVAVGTVAKG